MNACACPGCRAKLQIPEALAGKKIRCPKCQAPLVVPGAAARKPAAPPQPAPAPKKPAKATKPASDEAIFEPVEEPALFEAITDRPIANMSVKPAKKSAPARPAEEEASLDFDSKPAKRTTAAKKKKQGLPWLKISLIGGGIAVVILAVVGGVFVTMSFNKEAGRVVKAGVPKAAKGGGGAGGAPDAQPPVAVAPPLAVNAKPDFERPRDPLPSTISDATTQRVKRATTQVVVQTQDGTGSGSGFFAIERGLVFTNAHVVGMLYSKVKPKGIELVLNSGEPNEIRRTATLLGVDQEEDLAVLRVDGETETLPAPLNVDYLSPLTELQKVYIFGFPLPDVVGKNITVSESSISAFRKNKDGTVHQIQVNGGIQPGNSGGPIVDSRGNVIGVSVSIIVGTQINFAVPGERVYGLAQGRVLETLVGEPYRNKENVLVPLRLKFLDPLSKVKSLKLDYWTGQFGSTRPGSPTAPASEHGDGPKKTATMDYASAEGQVELPMPNIPVGQVLWVQPVLQLASGQTWAPAYSVTVSTSPPLERVPADLTLNFKEITERTIDLISKGNFEIHNGGRKFDISAILETDILETIQPKGDAFRAKLNLGNPQVNYTINGSPVGFDNRGLDLIRKASYEFDLGPQGRWTKVFAPSFKNGAAYLNVPTEIRAKADDFAGLIIDSYQVASFDLPQRETRPLETWQSKGDVYLTSGRGKAPAKLNLTCKFEGVRTSAAGREAFIRLEGEFEPKTKGGKAKRQTGSELKGKVQGHALLDLKRGFLSSVQVSVRSEVDLGDFLAVAVQETTVTRVPGNTRKITPPPPAEKDVKTNVILTKDDTLKPDDPKYTVSDPMNQYHDATVKLIGNKRYLIDYERAEGEEFDPYLFLENPNGQIVARDDDGGDDLNSRIVYTAPKTGDYRIIVTALQPITKPSKYSLRVTEVTGMPNIKSNDLVKDKKYGVLGSVVLRKENTLTKNDPVHAVKSRPHHAIPFTSPGRKRYCVDLKQPDGQSVDFFIVLADPKGSLGAHNIDNDNMLHDRFNFATNFGGEYTIIITTFEPVDKAAYTLRVIEMEGKEIVPVDPPRVRPVPAEPDPAPAPKAKEAPKDAEPKDAKKGNPKAPANPKAAPKKASAPIMESDPFAELRGHAIERADATFASRGRGALRFSSRKEEDVLQNLLL